MYGQSNHDRKLDDILLLICGKVAGDVAAAAEGVPAYISTSSSMEPLNRHKGGLQPVAHHALAPLFNSKRE